MPLIRLSQNSGGWFVAQNVLKLLANAGHPVVAMEGEHHDEAAVEENPFHNDVKADEVFEKSLVKEVNQWINKTKRRHFTKGAINRSLLHSEEAGVGNAGK